MSDTDPVVKRSDEIEYEAVDVDESHSDSSGSQNAERSGDAADGLRKGVLIDEEDGAPNFAIRRFELDAGAEVPEHTNEVEHEQYVLAGEYVVGIEDEEYTVSAGDSLLIPAGAVHWYRNEADRPGAFLCAVPNGDDAIELVEK
ncbi:cupin domain-containing protein [Halolamina salifodinae]|uniref:Quercetin dioxygenase-like cupin family protein n=1 Tax=Halolamina salifodinae TaxID=1202767 RepID=A0A8T4GVE2_9EURY|nr:cupin domain-containing protein [Halolamina salifodinae]MBP1986033.1 quercetin dioxygenase-like cupin family protein [Halolamina salifodinae]